MKVTVITATANPMDVIGILAEAIERELEGLGGQWRELMVLLMEVRND